MIISIDKYYLFTKNQYEDAFKAKRRYQKFSQSMKAYIIQFVQRANKFYKIILSECIFSQRTLLNDGLMTNIFRHSYSQALDYNFNSIGLTHLPMKKFFANPFINLLCIFKSQINVITAVEILPLLLMQVQSIPNDVICRLLSKKSSLALSLSTDRETFGILVLTKPSNVLQQLFRIHKKGDFYAIQSMLNEQFVSVLDNSNEPGAAIVSLPWFDNKGQRFRLEYVAEGEYVIHSEEGLVLDCKGEDVEEGTRIIQWKQSNRDHQVWRLRPI